MTKIQSVKQFLDNLNSTYTKLHKNNEELFWISYMGDHSVDKRLLKARADLELFQTNQDLAQKTKDYIKRASKEEKLRLKNWSLFFSKYQIPQSVLPIKKEMDKLENKIRKIHGERKEGYIDPKTKKFVEASVVKMRTIMRTNSDESLRKACFEATEKLAVDVLEDYIKLVGLRNKFAKALGYEDFYAYKVHNEEGMTKKELFAIFDDVYNRTKFAFDNIRKLEQKKPDLRKPWNFSFMMVGDAIKEEDPYQQFDLSLINWGRSFMAMGIDFKQGKLTLDLLDRKGKWNNGFCHWPDIVQYKNGKRIPGSSDFTCNVVFGQIGAGAQGLHTLFHEAGHAAHLLNVTEKDVCVSHEGPPMSTAWAETQSMFNDAVSASVEWKTRYLRNKEGNPYPFELYEKRLSETYPVTPLALMGIIFVSSYEKEIYETKNLTKDKVIKIAKKAFKKYFDRSEDSVYVLSIPHIYSFSSSASYHGYGLAELAVSQWRKYFHDKYGYIVDNKKVGKEMEKVWRLGSTKTFKEFVIMATGKKLSAEALVENVTKSLPDMLNLSKEKIKRLEKIPKATGPIKLNAKIYMVHGKKKIADNSKSFEDMALKYGQWLQTQKIEN